MSEPLTEAERGALWLAHTIKGPHFNRIIEAVERIVAAREAAARADERERIAQAIEAEAEGLYPHARRDFATAARIARGEA